MLEQVNTNFKFLAFFTALKVGVTGLNDVTVDVYGPSGSQIVTDANATELGNTGIYTYELTANHGTVGEYVAIFKTADTGVDMKHVPSIWVIGRAGLENLDESVASIPGAVWEEPTANHVTLDSMGEWVGQLLPVGVAAATWNADPAGFIPNSAGSILETVNTTVSNIETLLTAATIVMTQPISSDGGTITLVRGDTYNSALGRAITLTSDSWPDLTNSVATLTIRRRREAFGTGSDSILLEVSDTLALRDVGGNSQTLVFEMNSALTTSLLPGLSTGKFDVQATLADNSTVVTLVTGLVTVVEDQTR